jgi:hypothetical protein
MSSALPARTTLRFAAPGEDNQTVSSPGEMLFLESNTLTPILKKLERMEYLRRQRNSADERQVEDDRSSARGAGANCRNVYSEQ